MVQYIGLRLLIVKAGSKYDLPIIHIKRYRKKWIFQDNIFTLLNRLITQQQKRPAKCKALYYT
jgi:hypothetical protein